MICCQLVTFVVSLLRCDVFRHLVAMFNLCGAIQTSKTHSINVSYQIMVISTLKKWSCRYSNHYIVKFIGFILIYYDINLDIVLSFMVFSNLYLKSIDLLQV